MSAAEQDPKRKVNRRTLLKGAALFVASIPLHYDGFGRLAEADVRANTEIAAMPTPGYTYDEVAAAKTELARGYEYLGRLVEPDTYGRDTTIADLQSPSFATSETIVRNQALYDNEVYRIENDPDNLAIAEVVGGIVLDGAAIVATAYALPQHSPQRTTLVVSQQG